MPIVALRVSESTHMFTFSFCTHLFIHSTKLVPQHLIHMIKSPLPIGPKVVPFWEYLMEFEI